MYGLSVTNKMAIFNSLELARKHRDQQLRRSNTNYVEDQQARDSIAAVDNAIQWSKGFGNSEGPSILPNIGQRSDNISNGDVGAVYALNGPRSQEMTRRQLTRVKGPGYDSDLRFLENRYNAVITDSWEDFNNANEHNTFMTSDNPWQQGMGHTVRNLKTGDFIRIY